MFASRLPNFLLKLNEFRFCVNLLLLFSISHMPCMKLYLVSLFYSSICLCTQLPCLYSVRIQYFIYLYEYHIIHFQTNMIHTAPHIQQIPHFCDIPKFAYLNTQQTLFKFIYCCIIRHI